MERYIALLRSINVSGKNKIAMSELKTGFAELGYTAVSTHFDSGNVIFSSEVDDLTVLASTIKTMIKNTESMRKLLIIQMQFSGLLAVKIIKRQIGGQRQPVQV